MKFLDFFFGKRITTGIKADMKHEQLVEDLNYFAANRNRILLDLEEKKAFKRVSAEISKANGWLPYSPLDSLNRLTPEQVQEGFEIIKRLTNERVITRVQAEKIDAFIRKERGVE